MTVTVYAAVLARRKAERLTAHYFKLAPIRNFAIDHHLTYTYLIHSIT
jgi:hypothetical protein